MAIELVTRFEPYVDEIFNTESNKALVTNKDFDWTGAHSIKIYKVTTAAVSYTHLDVYKRQEFGCL